MALTLELDFTEMTWGELRRFVAACPHMPDDEYVEFATSPLGGDELIGLRADIPAGDAQ